MSSESGYESKITARLDTEVYSSVQEHFHHGQQTIFLRKVYLSIKKLIDDNKFDEITDYLYKDSSLTLPNVKV